MENIHSALGFSMEQTRWLLKRIVDGENRLVADLMFNNPMQLLDVMMCAATMLKAMEQTCPEGFGALFAKELPN